MFVAVGLQKKGEPKQVIFSDGIRPGGDLTELDAPSQPQLPVQKAAGRKAKKLEKTKQNGGVLCRKTNVLVHNVPTRWWVRACVRASVRPSVRPSVYCVLYCAVKQSTPKVNGVNNNSI